MEEQPKNCSLKSHNKYKAIIYCHTCKLNMCDKCSIYHSELFEDHKTMNLDKDKDIKNIFTGLCKEEKHKIELEYFCKVHNVLCCAACISKIQSKGNGKHKDCQICNIEEIKDEKRNKLKENIKYLEELSQTLEQGIKDLKTIFEKISKDKEDLKLNIQKIFTKIRNALNDREDQLLIEVDRKFNEIYFDEDLIKKSEKLPNKIKESLKEGKLTESSWNEEKGNLNYFINNCINIENNIIDINLVKENINKYNSTKVDIIFYPKEENKIEIYDSITKFGSIESDDISKITRIMKEQIQPYKDKNIKFKLIYDASKDGQNSSNCHSKCNNVPNTFSLVRTCNGIKFGLFRSIAINGNVPWRSDDKAFFISLDKEKIYKMKNGNYIAFDDSYFIQTYPFTLSGNILSNKYNANTKNNMNQYFEGFTEDYELSGGYQNFTVNKFEVYQLEFL